MMKGMGQMGSAWKGPLSRSLEIISAPARIPRSLPAATYEESHSGSHRFRGHRGGGVPVLQQDYGASHSGHGAGSGKIDLLRTFSRSAAHRRTLAQDRPRANWRGTPGESLSRQTA